MRVALVTPWDNAWVPMFKEEIEARGHEFLLINQGGIPSNCDVVLHGWTGMSPAVHGARNIMFLRRYELFEGALYRVNWSAVDHLICVNTWIADVVGDVFQGLGVKTPVSVIYNSVDTRKWGFATRRPNNRIGMACHVHPKKNLPLAAQVLSELPEGFELHIAGEVQDPCTAEYLNHMGKAMRKTIYLHGQLDRTQLNLFWEQMGFCLSSSISEGNPNNVLEAMAKGIKPVIHAWPGAEDQFPAMWLFNSAKEAAARIMNPDYDSLQYRGHVEQKFSLANVSKVVDLALGASKTVTGSTGSVAVA